MTLDGVVGKVDGTVGWETDVELDVFEGADNTVRVKTALLCDGSSPVALRVML